MKYELTEDIKKAILEFENLIKQLEQNKQKLLNSKEKVKQIINIVKEIKKEC